MIDQKVLRTGIFFRPASPFMFNQMELMMAAQNATSKIGVKKRNPVVIALMQRGGGCQIHGKTKKAIRRAGKVSLQRGEY